MIFYDSFETFFPADWNSDQWQSNIVKREKENVEKTNGKVK